MDLLLLVFYTKPIGRWEWTY